MRRKRLFGAVIFSALAAVGLCDEPKWTSWPVLPQAPRRAGAPNAAPDDWHAPYCRLSNFPAAGAVAANTSRIAFGGVLNHFVVMDPGAPTPAVLAALSFALPGVSAERATLLSARKLELQISLDGGGSHLVESCHYQTSDGRQRRFSFPTNLGVLFFLRVVEEKADTAAKRTHDLGVNLGTDGLHSVFQHTWVDDGAHALPSSAEISARGDAVPVPAIEPVSSIRTMTYNIWNTNPPMWLLHNDERRRSWYSRRMDHFAKVVRDADVAIVGLQEVRYDSTIVGNSSQIEHVTSRLPGYQFVYQPAMLYHNRDGADPLERVEEGPAIISRWPIVSTDYALLSHDPKDRDDVHQRVCLHAVVEAPGWGLVDVFTAHLSLSESSRERTMVEMWDFVRNHSSGRIQLLMGDFNAEPDSRGIQFLQGLAPLNGTMTDFQDCWLALHPEPKPRSNDTNEIDNMLTFPSCNPVKRIDFVMLRRPTKDVEQSVQVTAVQVAGQAPIPGTENFTGPGMLDLEPNASPIWASDHRAVLVELSL